MNIKNQFRYFLLLTTLFTAIHFSTNAYAESVNEYPQDMEALAGIVGDSMEEENDLSDDESISDSDISDGDLPAEQPEDASIDLVDLEEDQIAEESVLEISPDDSSTDSIVGNQPSDITTAEEAIINAGSMEGLYYFLPYGQDQKMMCV